MIMNRKSVPALIGLILILSFLLSACAQATDEPPKENVITYVYPRLISVLDPSLILSSENNISWNVYGTLTFWDPEKGIVPYMAESWESNEDATEWTFHLWEGMKCHDGTDFTAEDVKFSYERTIEAGALAYIFAALNEVEVVDDLTVRMKLNYPFRWDANVANSWGVNLMCDSMADKSAEWIAEGNGIGTGPYMFESYEPGVRLILTKFEDWWGVWPEGHFTKIVIEEVEDATVRVQKLRGGEADIAWGIPYDDFESLSATGEINAFAQPAFQQLQWHFNARRAPLDDLRVRQALSHAFPYEQAQLGTFGGSSVIAEGGVPRLQWDPAVKTTTYEYDLDKAQQLLEEAGVAEGTSFRLGVEVNAIEEIKTAELWQAELAKIGIDLVIDKISAGVRWGEVYNPDTEFDIMLLHMIIGFDSPNEYLGSVFHSGWTWYPFAGFDSPEFNTYIEDALALEAADKAESDRLYQLGEQILFDNAIAVFALDLPQDWAIATDVKGFVPNPLYGYDVYFWQMYRE
jgi:peptide/nickel transport system substrate-binding protein